MVALETKQVNIAASVSCFNLFNIQSQMQQVNACCDLLHFDVVDGSFNDCFILGLSTLEAIRPHTPLPIEVHLAAYHPEKFIKSFVKAGADYIAVHYEAAEDLRPVFDAICEAGARPVLALRAETEYQPGMDALLHRTGWVTKLMVNPGYSGQPFQRGAVAQLRRLREAISILGLPTLIQADGSMGSQTIPLAAAAGAGIFTGGSSGLFVADKTIAQAAADMRWSALQGRLNASVY